MWSAFDPIGIPKAAIEIPQEHAGSVLARNYARSGPAGKDPPIHASKDELKRAAVATKHRGYWFYIDETDI